jgi:hypothetical protein
LLPHVAREPTVIVELYRMGQLCGKMAILISVFEVDNISKASLMSSSLILLVISGLTSMVLDEMRFKAFLKCSGEV